MEKIYSQIFLVFVLSVTKEKIEKLAEVKDLNEVYKNSNNCKKCSLQDCLPNIILGEKMDKELENRIKNLQKDIGAKEAEIENIISKTLPAERKKLKRLKKNLLEATLEYGKRNKVDWLDPILVKTLELLKE